MLKVVHVRRAIAPVTPVQAATVAVAGVVVRRPVFARRERKPRRARAAAQRHAPVAAACRVAHEGNQRRRVHRARAKAARHPGPARADLRPAAVVRGRKTPGRVVDPGPAPGLDPRPAAIAVRRPVGYGDLRVPHGAVGGVLRPLAIGVELLVARQVARHELGRGRAVFQRVARGHPLVKRVALRRAGLGDDQRAPAVEHLLARADVGDLPRFAVHAGGARVHRQPRGVGARVDVDAVFARLRGHHGQLRGIDLHPLAGAQLAHAQGHAAVHQRHLRGVVVQLGHAQIGAAGQPDGERAAVQLGAAVRVGHDAGAVGHRPVDAGRREVAAIGGELRRAFLRADVGHARRWVGLRRGQQRRGQQGGGQPAAPGGGFAHRHEVSR